VSGAIKFFRSRVHFSDCSSKFHERRRLRLWGLVYAFQNPGRTTSKGSSLEYLPVYFIYVYRRADSRLQVVHELLHNVGDQRRDILREPTQYKLT
jgi:hypothetical protein